MQRLHDVLKQLYQYTIIHAIRQFSIQ